MDIDLSKVSRESLEEVLYSMIAELEEAQNPIIDKYIDDIEDELYSISKEEAQTIVHHFKPYSEVYSYMKVEEMLANKGIEIDECVVLDYYLVMNMMYNDFKHVAEAHNLDVKEFCYDMSKAFIDDIDAPKYKVKKYFRM